MKMLSSMLEASKDSLLSLNEEQKEERANNQTFLAKIESLKVLVTLDGDPRHASWSSLPGSPTKRTRRSVTVGVHEVLYMTV